MSDIKNIYAADTIDGNPVDVVIYINIAAPEFRKMEDLSDHQWSEAKALLEVLRESIPQGVMHKLFSLQAGMLASDARESSRDIDEISHRVMNVLKGGQK